MAIEFRSNVNFKRMKAEVQRRKAEGLAKGLEEAGRDIVRRSQSGIDADGQHFKPYTAKYAAYKFNGRNRGGFAGLGRTTSQAQHQRRAIKAGLAKGAFSNFGKVDLTLTGRMLEAITSSIARVGSDLIGKISFNSAREANKARGNMNKRRFFLLSDSQIAKIKQRIQEALNG